jgi:signal transduction histidine kinase
MQNPKDIEVYLDKNMAHILTGNLISNAIKYMTEGGAIIVSIHNNSRD